MKISKGHALLNIKILRKLFKILRKKTESGERNGRRARGVCGRPCDRASCFLPHRDRAGRLKRRRTGRRYEEELAGVTLGHTVLGVLKSQVLDMDGDTALPPPS